MKHNESVAEVMGTLYMMWISIIIVLAMTAAMIHSHHLCQEEYLLEIELILLEDEIPNDAEVPNDASLL